MQVMFCRDMRVAEHTSQPTNVRAQRVRCRRLQNLNKKDKVFFVDQSGQLGSQRRKISLYHMGVYRPVRAG